MAEAVGIQLFNCIVLSLARSQARGSPETVLFLFKPMSAEHSQNAALATDKNSWSI